MPRAKRMQGWHQANWGRAGMADTQEEGSAATAARLDIAVRLMALQERLAAFDRLYNEEIAGLTEGLHQLKADVVREYTASAGGKPPPTPPKRSRRAPRPPRAPRSTPK